MPRFYSLNNSFTKGQLSPWLKGRTDIEAYYQGAEEVKNFFIRPYGGAIRAPGTEYIAETKDSSKASRLIPFVFSVSQAYAIEAGDLYFRFFTNGGQVTTASGAFEVVSPYSSTEIDELQWAQSQDVLYIVHPDYKTRKLSRSGALSWSLDAETFYGGPWLEDNASATTVTPSATTGSITVTASAAIFDSDHVGALWKIGGEVSNVQGYVRITAFTSTTEVDATVVEELDGTGATDDWAEGAWSDYRGWPSTISFHEGRLWYGGNAHQPNKAWGSKPFLYDDFTPGTDDDDAVSREMPTRELNKIQWLSSERTLAVGTSGGEFTIGSGSLNEVITPSNVTAISRTVEGSESIVPVRIRNRTYYVQREARKLMEFYYIFEFDNYDSKNSTLFSEYITGTGIKEMSVQQNEDSIIWCVLNDGNIATLTREIDQQIVGWASHETDGDYESVCSIPRNDQFYDDVFVIVNRTIDGNTVRYVELFKNPRPFDELDTRDNRSRLWYVHSGLTYDGYQNTEDDSLSLTLSAKTGSGVTATSSGAIFDSADIGRRIRAVDSDGDKIGEAEITAVNSSTEAVVTVDQDFDATSYTAGSWAVSTDSLSGLDHLEGEDIAVLGDGSYLDDATVSSGTASISSDHFIVIAGLNYESKIELFPLEGGVEGTSQALYKKIDKIGLRLYKTLGLVVNNGEEDKDIFKIPVGYTLGAPVDLYTGIKRPFYNDNTKLEAGLILKQTTPLPANILAVIAFTDTRIE